MKRHGMVALLWAASAVAFAPSAMAQNGTQGTQEGATGEQAQAGQDSQCMQELQTLAQSMQEDGYWLSGYRGYGTSTMTAPSAGRGVAPTAPRPVEPTGELAVTPDGAEPARDGLGEGPWGGVRWEQRPQYQIGVLYEAAYILARNGDEEACGTMLEATRERYQSYVANLEELGVDPGEVTTWRQAEIAAAEPVSQFQGRLRIENIIDTEVRNAQDENLGNVEDVLLDPETGAVQYVVVNRGGLFGIGSNEVVVPWERLRTTPGMNTFVLPVQEATLEDAPSLEQEGLFDTQETGSIDTGEVDSYWQQVPQE